MEELEKELLELKEKARVLEEKIKKIKASKQKGRVEKGEKFYFISSDCDFAVDNEIEGNFPEDDYFFDIGNYFRTEDEAEQALEKIKIYTELKRFAEEHNTEEINWNDIEQKKYYININYRYGEDMITVPYTENLKSIGQIYFTSYEIAARAVKEIGEENIIKLFK